MPRSVYDRILVALDNLSNEQLLRFKYKLCELKGIGFGLIEREKSVEITQRLVGKFTRARAVACTAEVLRAIDLHENADNLENEGNNCQGTSVAGGTGGASSPAAMETGGSAASPSSAQTEGGRFVDKNQVQLIKRVTAVKPILDHFLQPEVGLISGEMYRQVVAEKTQEDQMRRLMYDVILPNGERAKDELVKILDSEQPYLMNDLRGT